MISVRVSQNGKKTDDWLRKISRGDISGDLSRYGADGVRALAASTPVETGLSAQSWGYRIKKNRRGYIIEWYNTDVTSSGVPVVILVQYGHATRGGTYISGRDFINPAMEPVFNNIADEIWKKVRNG